jgi:hypothetical protein
MQKTPEQMFPTQPESDESKRKTGREFMRNLFPGATKELDRAYERLDHLLKDIGGEIAEYNEGNGQDLPQQKGHSFRYDGKIYQSTVFKAGQIKVFIAVKEFVDKIDMPDKGEAASIDTQTERVRLLIGRLENILSERRLAGPQKRATAHN